MCSTSWFLRPSQGASLVPGASNRLVDRRAYFPFGSSIRRTPDMRAWKIRQLTGAGCPPQEVFLAPSKRMGARDSDVKRSALEALRGSKWARNAFWRLLWGC